MLTNQSKGFSLVELMVVVGIIGVLAAIGIPQFSKFQAKSRQSEVKSSLGALFTNQKTFYTEYSHYTVDLNNVGFGIQGRGLRYDIGFPGATNCSASYMISAAMTGAPIEDSTFVVATSLPITTGLNTDWLYGTPAVATVAVSCTETTFVAAGFGNPNSSATAQNNDDEWTINQDKRLTNVVNGIL